MLLKVLKTSHYPFYGGIASGTAHVAIVAALGEETAFADYCKFSGGSPAREDQRTLAAPANELWETTTLFPHRALTLLPCWETERVAFSLSQIKYHIETAFEIERDLVRSGRLVFDFRHARLEPDRIKEYNDAVREIAGSRRWENQPGELLIFRHKKK